MSNLFMNMQRGEQAEHNRYHHQQQKQQLNGRRQATPAASFSSTNTEQNAAAAAEAAAAEQRNEEDDEEDPFANILNLKLKKPAHWKWELTTSRSCTNIALPRILLYDHTGQLLVDADSQAEQTYNATTTATEHMEEQQQQQQRRRHRHHSNAATTRKRAATTANLMPTILSVLDKEFNGLHIAEATPTPTTTTTPIHSHATTPTRTPTPSSMRHRHSRSPVAANSYDSGSCIDFYTNELPDATYRQQQHHQQQIERRSSSLRGVRFLVDDNDIDDRSSYLPTPTPTSPPSTIITAATAATASTTTTATTTTTPTTGSTSSGAREKRRYRRSHSSSGRSPAQSVSILERFSYNRGRFSSPEYAAEHEIQHAPRYYLRTSKAGTLVIQEESFSRQRVRRRRPKHSSSENILGDSGGGGGGGTTKSLSTNSLTRSQNNLQHTPLLHNRLFLPTPQTGSLQNMHELQRKKSLNNGFEVNKSGIKTLAKVRRYRSDGNVLLQQEQHPRSSGGSSGSDAEANAAATATVALKRKGRSKRNFGKHFNGVAAAELVTIDPDNCVYRAGQAPTAR